jgi:Family of unknown function (DUF5923)
VRPSSVDSNKIVNDAAVLVRSMAGDAASKAADKVNPSDEALANIDRPAEDNTWHDTPNISKDQIKGQLNQIKPFGKKDLQDAAAKGTSTAHPDGSTDPADVANLAAKDQQQGTASGVDAYSGASAAAGLLKDRASQNVPDEHKETAEQTKNKTKEYNERTRQYFKGKMPKERREQTIWRLKKMVVEIQGHGDCKSLTITPNHS